MEGAQDDPLAMGRWCIRQKLHDLLLLAVHQPALTTCFLGVFLWVWPVTGHGMILATTSVFRCNDPISATAVNISVRGTLLMSCVARLGALPA